MKQANIIYHENNVVVYEQHSNIYINVA